jgi:GT2 family glycosyltransferase
MTTNAPNNAREVRFSDLLTPTYTGPEIRHYLGGAWSMHLPFAWDLVREFRPRILVELGVYRGESYFTFCQSVDENRLPTLCYGIDTFRGDIHMGMYGPEIGEEAQAYNSRYARFSTLLEMTFNEALVHFRDGSIDLLHIDGAHRYEEVKQDFESWLPKLSSRGIILFHDVMERKDDFGVWRLWREIARPGASFVFEFGHGLGVWKKNDVSRNDSPFIRKLLLGDKQQRHDITARYAITAAALNLTKSALRKKQENNSALLQVFALRDGAYSEDYCSTSTFPKGRWRRVEVKVSLPMQDASCRLRFDPGGEVGVVEIAAIRLVARATREILWSAHGVAELSNLIVGGTAQVVSHDHVLRILNYGLDPHVLLPPLPEIALNSPFIFQIWLRLDTAAERIAQCFELLQERQRRENENKTTALRELEQQRSALTAELRASEQKREAREIELRSAEEQRAALAAALHTSEQERKAREIELRSTEEKRAALTAALHERQVELGALRSEIERLEREVWDNKVRRADLAARLQQRDEWITEVKRSLAWKAAKPLWKLQRHFGRRKSGKLEQTAHDDLVFALDTPPIWNPTRDSVELKGWCFTRGGPPIVGVRAKIGRKSYFARYGLARQDVAQAAPESPAALYSGFSISLPMTRETVHWEAIAQNSPWRCFLKQELAPSPEVSASASTPQDENDHAPSQEVVPPVNANGEQLVLYPSATADQVESLLSPLIELHLRNENTGKPLFSIITPVFNASPRWLVEAGASLLNQRLANWEWCLVDDGSNDPETRRVLDSLSNVHSNFRVKLSPNRGISAASNEGLDMAEGEFVCFLDQDDLLQPDALQMLFEKINNGYDVVYSDEDKLDDKDSTLAEPFFKPDWSPEYFRGAMYVGHLLCVGRELARTTRFDSAFDGVQDFEFMLRVSEKTNRIGHVPKILYHWRKTPGSIAQTADAKPQAALLQQKAVNAQLQRLGLAAEAKIASIPHRLKILPLPRSNAARVSIIVPTKDAAELLGRCLKSIYENTTHPNFEVLLVDNDTTDREATEIMRRYPITRMFLPNPFNFSRANNLAARRASGEYLVFLNNDTEIISEQWLDHLVYYAEQPDVGAVGALLLHTNGTVQHAGVVLGMRGTADHGMRGFTAESDGYAGSLSCAREVSAVTAACMAMRKSTFEEIGGFNEHFFTIYQDVDLCLRLRQRGLRIIWTPQALLLHQESHSRQKYYDLVDRYLLLDQWENVIKKGDPYYNRNLNMERGDYSICYSG